MSYGVNATQAKWFGFQPKYVWDDFVRDHATTSRKIKSATFPFFMEIEDCEAKIKIASKKILDEEGINVSKLIAISKRERENIRRMPNDEPNLTTVMMRNERENLSKMKRKLDCLEEIEENEEYEKEYESYETKEFVTYDYNEDDKDESFLGYVMKKKIQSGLYDDGEALEIFAKKLLEKYAKENAELRSLKLELEECQKERDTWRKKYYENVNCI